MMIVIVNDKYVTFQFRGAHFNEIDSSTRDQPYLPSNPLGKISLGIIILSESPNLNNLPQVLANNS
jgi:hypothetical protein